MAQPDHLGVTISGLDDLQRMFREVGAIGTKQAVTAAARKALEPIRQQAIANAPVDTAVYPAVRTRGRWKGKPRPPKKKRIRDSMVIRSVLPTSQRRKRGGRRRAIEAFLICEAPHAHLVEWGHRLVKGATTKGTVLEHTMVRIERGKRKGQFVKHVIRRADDATVGRQIGYVPAHPFMRPAFDARKREAATIFFQLVGGEVQRVAKRYSRQALRGKLSRGARVAYQVSL